jgi:DnaK suppressor protein
VEEARARELLARERERVERSLASLEEGGDRDELSYWDQHPADFATELFDAELGDSLAAQLRLILEKIERAEERLDKGTYGLSVESGRPIPDERLEAIPWADRTAEEQERQARRMRMTRPAEG